MQGIFNTIIRMSLQGTVIFLILSLVRLCLKKLRISHSYLVALWLVLFFYLVFPWKVSLPVGFWNQSMVREMQAVQELRENSDVEVPGSGEEQAELSRFVALLLGTGASSQEAEYAMPEEEGATVNLWQFLPYLWALVTLILSGHLVVSYLVMRRKLQLSTVFVNGIGRSEALTTPMVFGLLHPRVYLPICPEPENQETELYSCVILHEQMHIRRGDFLWKLLAYGACLLHWFNPLVWLAYHLLAADMEKACDEAVVRHLGEERRKEYAYALLRGASGVGSKSRRIFVAPICFDKGDVKARITNVVSYRRTMPAVGVLVTVGVMALAAVFGTRTEAETKNSVDIPVTISEKNEEKYTGQISWKREVVFVDDAEIPVLKEYRVRDKVRHCVGERYASALSESVIKSLARDGLNLNYGSFLEYEISVEEKEDIPLNEKHYTFRSNGERYKVIITWEEGVEPEYTTPLTSAVVYRISEPSLNANIMEGNVASVFAIQLYPPSNDL